MKFCKLFIGFPFPENISIFFSKLEIIKLTESFQKLNNSITWSRLSIDPFLYDILTTMVSNFPSLYSVLSHLPYFHDCIQNICNYLRNIFF